VSAVREGRGIYANIVKFTRFQVSTALGFVTTFLVAAATGIAGGAPFSALQILFVNLVMDGPPAMSLGVDPVSPDVMRRPPRPLRERILTRPRFLRILLASAVMAAGTLAVLVWGPGPEPRLDAPTTAGTMAFATFVFFQAFNLLNLRSDTGSVFTRATFENRWTFIATSAVVLLLVLVVEADVLHGVFTTTDLASGQWLACVAIGSTILWVSEVVKFVLRRRNRSTHTPA
jgi:Ca2+-transporting ATPase